MYGFPIGYFYTRPKMLYDDWISINLFATVEIESHCIAVKTNRVKVSSYQY